MILARFVVRRLARALVVIVGLVAATFFIAYGISDPVGAKLGPQASAEQRSDLTHQLGLDRPLLDQFGHYLWGMLHGDFGTSLWQGQSAIKLSLDRIPASFLLAIATVVIAAPIGLALGVVGGVRPRSWVGRVSSAVSSVALGTPEFFLGILLIIVFAVDLGWLPAAGYGGFPHLLLPAITLSILPAGRLARVARESVIDELGKPYVVSARARGLTTRQIVMSHVLKNIVVPTSTILGYDVLLLFTGYGAAVEVVFSWPGIGRLGVQTTLQQDVVLITALVVVTGVIMNLGNVVLDVLHAVVDRRIAA